MVSILAISGDQKVTVFLGLTQKVAAVIRRELLSAEENFDMFGDAVCKYRLRKE